MNWFVYAILIASVIFCGASDCKERAPDRHEDCQPELTSSSDPLPSEIFFQTRRNIERGRAENYLCEKIANQPLHYQELEQPELERRCSGSSRTRGCYVPGLGEHSIYVIRDPPRWVVTHELAHYLICVAHGLCGEDESHTWMGRQGFPGVPKNRKPPD